jgi:hypothetical protein
MVDVGVSDEVASVEVVGVVGSEWQCGSDNGRKALISICLFTIPLDVATHDGLI